MVKKICEVMMILIMGILLCACNSNETDSKKVIIEIPITLENWEDYFELKSRTEVINEERRIKEAKVFYEIALKDEYLDIVVTDKESEIKFNYEHKRGTRAITFVEGRNEIILGEVISLSSSETEERSIYNAVFEDLEYDYETGDMWVFGVQTKDAEADIQTLEEFKMLEIEGNLYLYSD